MGVELPVFILQQVDELNNVVPMDSLPPVNMDCHFGDGKETN